MARLANVALAFSLPLLGAALFLACVGDDAASSSSGSTPGTDSGGTTPPPVGNDGSVDPGKDGATSTCAMGTADCDGDPANGCETDTRSSALHCGACGHACGGSATCGGGTCTVEKLRDGLDHPFALALSGPRLVWYEGAGDQIRGCRADDCGASTAILVDVMGAAFALPNPSQSPRQIAVDATKFYFSQCPTSTNSDCRIAACDLTGCKLTGASFVAPASGTRRAPIVVGGPNAVYTHQGLDGLIKTDLVAKTESYVGGIYKLGDQLGGMFVDTTRFVYLDDNASQANPTGGVYLCPIAGCTGAPTLLLPPPVKHLAFAKDTVFTTTGGPNASMGSLVACPVTGCQGGGTVLAKSQAFISDVAADDTAVYWTTAGTTDVRTNSAAVGTVMRCALPSCAGGPEKIADQMTNPVAVRIDATYVYWMTAGGVGTKDGAVYRRRR